MPGGALAGLGSGGAWGMGVRLRQAPPSASASVHPSTTRVAPLLTCSMFLGFGADVKGSMRGLMSLPVYARYQLAFTEALARALGMEPKELADQVKAAEPAHG